MAFSSPRFSSPRPTPKFFTEAQTFSTKKARGTPRECLPPRPPVKSAPPLSRVFGYRIRQKALPVSFRRLQKENCLNPNYDENITEPYFNQCFEVVSKIGAGSFGEVYKVKSKTDGRYYAVKVSREAFRGESDRKRKLEEVAKHEKLRHHPNCVNFNRAWEEQGKLYLQTELCKTSLYDFAEKNHDIPETLIWKYLVDLLMAVKHLHNHNLIHMDIKSENIFLSFNDVCKLGDFGLVLDLSKRYDMLDAQEGDPKYLAPELLEGKFGKPADIFSLGIILELSGDLDLPRGGEGWHLLRNGKIPEEFLQGRSFDLKYVIRQMLDHDPNSRPSVDQLLAFPCVRKVYKRRMREYMVNNVVSKADRTLKSLVGFIFMFLTLIFTYPFSKILKKKYHLGSSKAALRVVDTSRIDYGVSDDEPMDVHESSTSSLCVPLDNSTSFERSPPFDDGDCMLEQRRAMKAYTTPIMRRKWTSIISSRTVSPNFPRKLDLVSTPATDSLLSQCSTSSEKKRPVTPILMSEENIRPIAPKNLLGMFDAASDEDQL